MSRTPKCRAKGGPDNCKNPNCPEKVAQRNAGGSWRDQLRDQIERLERIHENTHRDLSPLARGSKAVPLKAWSAAHDVEINQDILDMFPDARESYAAAGTRAHEEAEAYYAQLQGAAPDASVTFPPAQMREMLDEITTRAERLNLNTFKVVAADGKTSMTVKTDTEPAPLERATARSLKSGDVIAFDDHGGLTPQQVIVKVENRDSENTRITWRDASDKSAPTQSEWVNSRTPISVFKRKAK